MTENKPTNAPDHCPGTESESAGHADACSGCPNQTICQSVPKDFVDPDLALIQQSLSLIKHKIIILSGKGGCWEKYLHYTASIFIGIGRSGHTSRYS